MMSSHFHWGVDKEGDELSNMHVVLHRIFLWGGKRKTEFIVHVLRVGHYKLIFLAFLLCISTLIAGITCPKSLI